MLLHKPPDDVLPPVDRASLTLRPFPRRRMDLTAAERGWGALDLSVATKSGCLPASIRWDCFELVALVERSCERMAPL